MIPEDQKIYLHSDEEVDHVNRIISNFGYENKRTRNMLMKWRH